MLPIQWEASVHSGQTPWLTGPQLFTQADEWRFFLSANYLASKLIKSFLYPTTKLYLQTPPHNYIASSYAANDRKNHV